MIRVIHTINTGSRKVLHVDADERVSLPYFELLAIFLWIMCWVCP